MPEAAFAKAETLPPEAQLLSVLMAQFLSRLIHLTARLKLADYLGEGSRTAEELALRTATHAPTLYRVLRTLSSVGFFTEDTDHRFSLRPLGAALRSGSAPHATALVLGGENRSALAGPYRAFRTDRGNGVRESLRHVSFRLAGGSCRGSFALQPDDGGCARNRGCRGGGGV